MNRSRVIGTLEENVKTIEDKVKLARDTSVKTHLSSMLKLGQFLLTSGLYVKTQDVASLFGENTWTKRPSAELYHVITTCKHLNVVQF